jgi:hypothetical protein
MAARQATWREHYFAMDQADLSLPKFAQIAGLNFKDMLQKAVKLEISTRRGDWSVPEIDITDGRIVQAPSTTTDQVEDAVRQLRGAPEEDDPVREADYAGKMGDPEWDETEPPEQEPEQLQEDDPPPEVRSDPPAAPPVRSVVPPRAANTPDQGEIMIGGGPTPNLRERPATEVDPWAPPPKSKIRKVEVGATITFGKKDGSA